MFNQLYMERSGYAERFGRQLITRENRCLWGWSFIFDYSNGKKQVVF